MAKLTKLTPEQAAEAERKRLAELEPIRQNALADWQRLQDAAKLPESAVTSGGRRLIKEDEELAKRIANRSRELSVE